MMKEISTFFFHGSSIRSILTSYIANMIEDTFQQMKSTNYQRNATAYENLKEKHANCVY